MKNFIQISIFTFAFLLPTFASAQNYEVANSDLALLAGKTMKGQLSYLDYSDDTSTETLKCELTTSKKKGSLKTVIVFEEKDKKGNPYRQSSKFKISKDQRTLSIGKEKWIILESSKNGGEMKIIAVKKGTDNNKAADFRMTVELNASGKINWKKEVRYSGEDKVFLRNQYSFSK